MKINRTEKLEDLLKSLGLTLNEGVASSIQTKDGSAVDPNRVDEVVNQICEDNSGLIVFGGINYTSNRASFTIVSVPEIVSVVRNELRGRIWPPI